MYPVLSVQNARALPNLCIHCKYFIPNFFSNDYATCARFPKDPDLSKFLVTGKMKMKPHDFFVCFVARKYDHLCGKEGKMFERKWCN